MDSDHVAHDREFVHTRVLRWPTNAPARHQQRFPRIAHGPSLADPVAPLPLTSVQPATAALKVSLVSLSWQDREDMLNGQLGGHGGEWGALKSARHLRAQADAKTLFAFASSCASCFSRARWCGAHCCSHAPIRPIDVAVGLHTSFQWPHQRG